MALGEARPDGVAFPAGPFLEDHPHARMVLIAEHDVARSVRRIALNDDDLDLEPRNFLRHQRIERLAAVACLVARGQ